MILVLSVLGVILLKELSPKLKSGIFVLMFLATVAFGYGVIMNAKQYASENGAHKIHIYSLLSKGISDPKEAKIRPETKAGWVQFGRTDGKGIW